MMIKRNITRDGNLLPRAWNVLSSIPDEASHHIAHGKRHPKSAYGTSLRAISERWLKTFDRLDGLYEEHHREGKHSGFTDLLAEYRELLYRLNEHLDACFSVLRVLRPLGTQEQEVFDLQFLDRSRLPGWRRFKQAISPYRREHIGTLVNTMKHRQGELCMIYFYSAAEFRPGYFLRDVLPDGSLGPSAKLHASGETAFSFSRDMMMHFWWIYRIGELLAETVENVVYGIGGHEAAKMTNDGPDINWPQLVARCARLKPEFFPDESNKPYPRILCHADVTALTVEFPTTARGHRIPSMKVSVGFTVDGDHPWNKLPYFPKHKEDGPTT